MAIKTPSELAKGDVLVYKGRRIQVRFVHRMPRSGRFRIWGVGMSQLHSRVLPFNLGLFDPDAELVVE